MDLKTFSQKFKNKRTVYLTVFIVFVGVLSWAFITAGIITKNFNREQLVGKENNQDLEVSGMILTETKEDKKYWEIYSEQGHYSSDNKVAILDNVAGNFYKNNEVAMSFESSAGTYNEVKKQIILYKNTHIVLKDGTTLYCDRMIWSGSDKNIIATGHIKIIKNKELVTIANKAIINPNYSDFKIVGKTVTKLYDIKEQK